jgi:hypothetical protein
MSWYTRGSTVTSNSGDQSGQPHPDRRPGRPARLRLSDRTVVAVVQELGHGLPRDLQPVQDRLLFGQTTGQLLDPGPQFMVESEIAERIAARRAELDELEEQLVKQLAQVRAERDELAVAERVWQRMAEQLAAETKASAPPTAQVAGRPVLMVPHREGGMDETVLPPEYQKVLAIVRDGAGQWRPGRSARRWGWR